MGVLEFGGLELGGFVLGLPVGPGEEAPGELVAVDSLGRQNFCCDFLASVGGTIALTFREVTRRWMEARILSLSCATPPASAPPIP